MVDGALRRQHGQQGRSTRRSHLLASDVPPAVPHLSNDAPPQHALLRRRVAQHRRAEPHQLRHALRPQDPHDDVSRNGPARLHADALGHRQLDAARLREVRNFIRKINTQSQVFIYLFIYYSFLYTPTRANT